jgi:glycosyltransferase involved in cell wall biosynthesis
MKIAYISEVDKNSKQTSGATTRDALLLESLTCFSDVTFIYNDTSVFFKYKYLFKNSSIGKNIVSELNSRNYDLVIISVFHTSPSLSAYEQINAKKIYYFADSAFHFGKQYLGLRYKLLAQLFKMIESSILKKNICAYLGADEIDCIPSEYKSKAIIFPFHAKPQKISFNNKGKLILVGDFNFAPNLKMLEKINNIASNFYGQIFVYGKNIPDLNYKSNIKIVGYVDSLAEVYYDARALLYPIDYGTGVKNKVLEALTFGVPTIGFKEAFTNMGVKHKINGIIIDNVEDMFHFANSVDLTSISKGAYELALRDYSLEGVSNKILQSIQKVIYEK